MPELASAGPGPAAVQLLEVRVEDAPNVLTNDPGFFSHKTGDAAVLELYCRFRCQRNFEVYNIFEFLYLSKSCFPRNLGDTFT